MRLARWLAWQLLMVVPTFLFIAVLGVLAIASVPLSLFRVIAALRRRCEGEPIFWPVVLRAPRLAFGFLSAGLRAGLSVHTVKPADFRNG